uniref:(northern house mosquito) hypothetical protein n=1 Tax=Culex pipiens TaxID=7175 RepID=A0A8D8PFN1_CULPI
MRSQTYSLPTALRPQIITVPVPGIILKLESESEYFSILISAWSQGDLNVGLGSCMSLGRRYAGDLVATRSSSVRRLGPEGSWVPVSSSREKCSNEPSYRQHTAVDFLKEH